MDEVKNKIKGYITHFRKDNFQDILSLLHPSRDVCDLTLERLLMAGEEGLSDYKMSIINPLFTFINNTKNNIPSRELLAAQVDSVCGALLVLFIQKQYTSGTFKLSGGYETRDETPLDSRVNETIDQIMTELNKSIVIDSGINKNKYINNVLHSIRELEEVKESFSHLVSTIAENKKEAYMKNYSRIVRKIEKQIRENYRKFHQTNNDGVKSEMVNPGSVSLKYLTPIVTVQMEILIKIYVTLCFALGQGKGMNTLVFPLIVEKRNLIMLLKKEENAYKNSCAGETDEPEELKNRMKWVREILYKEVLSYFRKYVSSRKSG